MSLRLHLLERRQKWRMWRSHNVQQLVVIVYVVIVVVLIQQMIVVVRATVESQRATL
jgi:hypothetical protein